MAWLAVTSATLLMVALGTIVFAQPRGKRVSISHRAASQRWARMLFAVALSFCGGTFVVWLGESFDGKLPRMFEWALGAGLVSLVTTAWAPARPGRRNVHWVAAYCLGLAMTVMMAALAWDSREAMAVRVVAGIVVAWYAYTEYVWLMLTRAVRFTVVFQLINVVSFLAIFLVASVA